MSTMEKDRRAYQPVSHHYVPAPQHLFSSCFCSTQNLPRSKATHSRGCTRRCAPAPFPCFFAAVPAPLTRHHGQRLGGWDRYKLVYIYQVQEREIGREQQSDRVQWEVNILTVLNGEDEVGANLGEETTAMTYSSHSLEQQ